MYTHDELDQMNKDPLRRAAHELLTTVEEHEDNLKRFGVLVYLAGVAAVLLASLLWGLAFQMGFWKFFQFLFWIFVTAAAVYGILAFWRQHHTRFSENWSNGVRASVAKRLQAYGEKLENNQEASSQRSVSDQRKQKSPRWRDRLMRRLEGNTIRTQGGDGP